MPASSPSLMPAPVGMAGSGQPAAGGGFRWPARVVWTLLSFGLFAHAYFGGGLSGLRSSPGKGAPDSAAATATTASDTTPWSPLQRALSSAGAGAGEQIDTMLQSVRQSAATLYETSSLSGRSKVRGNPRARAAIRHAATATAQTAEASPPGFLGPDISWDAFLGDVRLASKRLLSPRSLLAANEAMGSGNHSASSGHEEEEEDICAMKYISEQPDPCAFVKENCPADSVIDYYGNHFCWFGSPALSWLSYILLIIWVGVIFVVISFIADAFVLNLRAMSLLLKLSDNMAGVTLLAVGNGAPDLFGSIASVTSDNPNLALGQLLGGGVFVTTVVVAAIGMQQSFRVNRRPFVRDILFYTAAVLFMFFNVLVGSISLWKSLLMIGFYVAYVITVFVGHFIYRRMKAKRLAAALDAGLDPDETSHTINSTASDSPDLEGDSPSPALEFGDEYAGIDDSASNIHSVAVSAAQKQGRLRPRRPLSKVSTEDNTDDEGNSPDEHLAGFASIPQDGLLSDGEYNFNETSGLLAANSSPVYDVTPLLGPDPPASKKPSMEEEFNPETLSMTEALFPVVTTWAESSPLDRIVNIIGAPFVFFMHGTIPRVDHGRALKGWNKNMSVIHTVTVPLWIALSTGVFNTSVSGDSEFSVWMLLTCLGALLAIPMLLFTKSRIDPPFFPFFSFVGFASSALWIYLISGELIGALATLGRLCNLSDTILGLTILAWGNSIGDLIANPAIARKGFPAIGVSACFGGPLLNLLLGLGIAFTIRLMTYPEAEYPLTIDTNLYAAFAGLLMSLVMSGIVIPVCGWRAGRNYAIVLLVFYLAYLSTNIAIEFA
ncbi:hypothetical protein H696_00648 [Fonticula alba]|uniref:Sodium/calcium exchanger membrane region domain-containing protein n=1 Tax=Fonticula alba TaxID=691883 RepID=A0A058ZGP4_FONAL|nr:hypothetical protein H696_00648 [Fonticula alba]KCV73103.1 hypothetical protein H696_00648 [Fonticula alba]|eukprot:XP_009492804.1 hypothetical protein H696_00648 [Fonticula alba]